VLARLISAFLLSAVCCLLSSCVTITPRSQHAGPTATVVPDMPLQKWGIESCGAGSLSTILQHYGDPTSMQTWDATLPKMRGGVLTVDMLIAARSKGFDARLVTGDRATIENELRDGHPAILMLKVVDTFGRSFDFFHYIVVDGIDPDRGLIRTQFGDATPRWTSFARLENAWAGGGHAAILIHPGDPVAGSIRAAVALEDKGDYASAANEYRKLLAAHPDSSLAWTNLGNAEMQLGHRKESEDAFRHALTLDANSRDALNNIAWLLLQEKRVDEAETFARRAVAQKGPDAYVVLDTLARVLAAKGDCVEAEKTMQQAREYDAQHVLSPGALDCAAEPPRAGAAVAPQSPGSH
jgi:hypothetical protein